MRPILFRSLLALALSHCMGGTANAMPTAPCPWCGTADAPASIGSTGRIAPASEPGTPLEITGVVYRADGRTPVAGVVVYAHHANARGVTPGVDATHDHGTMRGWARTDSAGRYRFVTVRPGGSAPRVEMTAAAAGGREVQLPPLLLDAERPVTDARGVQHVVRDITLERLP